MNKSIVILLIVFALLGCKKDDHKVLARVGKSVLTEQQFYSLIPPEYANSLTIDQKKELLKMWVNTELLHNQALKTKLNKEKEVKDKISILSKQLLANEFLERYLSKISSVSEAEVKKYFEDRQQYYNSEREVAQIVVKDELEANQIIAKLKEGYDFSKLAREYSLDSLSAANGGVMGYVRLGDLAIPELEEALFSLKEIGEVSSPIRTVFGYHIIKLLGMREIAGKQVDYNDVKDRIRNNLNLPKRNNALDSLLIKLRDEQKVVENYDLIQ